MPPKRDLGTFRNACYTKAPFSLSEKTHNLFSQQNLITQREGHIKKTPSYSRKAPDSEISYRLMASHKIKVYL